MSFTEEEIQIIMGALWSKYLSLSEMPSKHEKVQAVLDLLRRFENENASRQSY